MLVSAMLFGAFRTAAAGEDPAKTTGRPESIETKAAKATPIPNFAAVYGLSFNSTHSLGHRLMEARQKGDPVALALIGTELAVDEEVSGKKADITSAELLSEAKDLAKLRRKDKELAAVALLLKDTAAAKELTDLVGPAKKAEAERIAKFKSGERERGIRVLEVINRTEHHLSIRVNGEHVGWIDPFSAREWLLPPHHHHPPELFLSAHDDQGQRWHSQYFTGEYQKFTWTLIL